MLDMIDISKRFGTATALQGVGLRVEPGTIHGVLGENGAGKTTLMRIAAGLLRADAGTVCVGDEPLPPASPQAARRAGLAMVHQHFCLVPTLTVAENYVLGRRDRSMLLSRRRLAAELQSLGRRSGLEVDPAVRVDALSVGQRQRVEILRALADARRVLILDEPTAVLTPQETDGLFDALDRLRRDGLAIVFISHKLPEVARICDRLTILRRTERVYDGPARDLSIDRMAELMVGSTMPALPDRPAVPADAPALLRIENLSAEDPRSHRRIRDITLTVRAGEIVGIAGVEGNGQDVLGAVLVGTLRPGSGRVFIADREVARAGVAERVALGLAHIPEDRLSQALAAGLSLQDNLILKTFRTPAFSRRGWLSPARIRAHAEQRLTRYDVRPPDPDAEAGRLSGGNQQKVVLARELGGQPRVVIAQHPARGLDVAATQFVFEQLLAQRARGAAVLLIHSDLDELLMLADRVAVMAGGRCMLTDWPTTPRAEIGRLMLTGVS